MSLELRLTSQRKHGSRDKSSASAGPPHLPQELIDLIIDHLAFDSDFLTLQSCSLAASSWLPRSRGHLFNAVSLEPDDFPQAETHFGHSAPHLAQFVRKLYIRTGATDEEEDEEPVPRDNELTPSLLALFTRVDSLHLVHMRWDDLRPSVRDYFHSGYLELSTLHLGDVEFSKSSHLLHFLRCLPRLTLLHLRRVTWCSKEEGHHHRGPEHSRLAHLREVRVYECTSSAVFICGLFCGGNGEALERIALDWGESENPDVLRRLILTAGESLQTLEVDVSWQGMWRINYPVDHNSLVFCIESAVPLDLGRNCNLEELWGGFRLCSRVLCHLGCARLSFTLCLATPMDSSD